MGGVLLNWFAGNPSDLTRRCFLGSAAAPALGTLAGQAGAGAATTVPMPKVVGYLPDYRLGGFQAQRCQSLTSLVCFSVQLQENGQLSGAAAQKVNGFRELKKTVKKPFHLCVGGWEEGSSTHICVCAVGGGNVCMCVQV